MKKIVSGFVVAALALVVLAAGCATSAPDPKVQRKERLLMQCGFKLVPASTPQQMQQMTTLPPNRISVVNRNGNRYYVYPDPLQKALYVGRDAQYQAYSNQRSNMEETAQYDQFSKRDPSLTKYENEAEVLSGIEYSAGWDQGWGSWDNE